MQTYDGWEPLRDDNNPQREKMLGKGGQGEVYLVRSSARVMQRQKLDEQALQILLNVGTLTTNSSELARCLVDLGKSDPVESLGALKKFKIPSDNKDEEEKAIGRLKLEIEALQNLKGQSGILQLMDANVEQRFIITEYHPRGTLNKHIGMFKGNVLAALEAFKPLVDAVCKIHEVPAIHRDIKTENIFVTSSGNLILGDFGIVFFQGGSERLTTTYERVGSHEWMAPWAYNKERLELSKISPALDIFPLAKVLWSMIAGQNGFAFWEYDHDENNLEKLFPNDPTMHLVNSQILSKCIVRNEKDCDGSASSLLSMVETLISHIKLSRGFRVAGASTWPCRVCGMGNYRSGGYAHRLRAHRQGGPPQEQELVLNVYVCDHCGHAELFKS
jgi:serine/threonine protein kinase